MKRGCRWRSLIHGSRSLCNRATRDELELDRRIEIFRGYHESLARNPVRNSILPLQRCTKSFLGRFRHRKLALSFFFFFFSLLSNDTRISTVRLLRARDGLVPLLLHNSYAWYTRNETVENSTLVFRCVVQT